MTRRLVHTIAGLALAGGLSGGLSASVLLAQRATSARPASAGVQETGRQQAGQHLEGTWLVTIIRADAPPGAPPIRALVTFLPTGQFLGETNTAAIRSLSHGEWVRRGERRFTALSLTFRFDAARTFIGYNRITSDIRLNRRGDEYVSDDAIETFDAAGQLLLTVPSTLAGRLCGIATSMARCLGLE